jgi:hypothetical protein
MFSFGIDLTETTSYMIKILILFIALNQESLILFIPFSIDLIHISCLALRRVELLQSRVCFLLDLRHLLFLFLHFLKDMCFVYLTTQLVG